MKVINIFGGPAAGKSTISAGLFHFMKCAGLNVELVTEYAKEMIYENRTNIMDDQLYVFAKQYRRIARLKDHVDYVITDSPILLAAAYTKAGYYKSLKPLIFETFGSFDNINIVLKRHIEQYKQDGRIQNQQEALQKDVLIQELLIECSEEYQTMDARSPDILPSLYNTIANSYMTP